MLSEVFYWLLSMSITASVSGIMILLVRMIKKLPRRFITFLWLIPFIRLTVPFGINGKYGIISLFSVLRAKTVIVYDGVSLMNCVDAAESYSPFVYKTDLLAGVFSVSSVVWLSAALAMIIFFSAVYTVTLRELRDAKHIKDNLFSSDKITSPAVYGVFFPRIIIPVSYEHRDDLDYILAHENAHIKRFDNFMRAAAIIFTAVHWFNPLIWIFLKCFLADLEISCDETVLEKLNAEQRKEYALTLVSSAAGKNVFVSAFGGAKIKTRVQRILTFEKITAAAAVAFSVLAVFIAYVLLTNAV